MFCSKNYWLWFYGFPRMWKPELKSSGTLVRRLIWDYNLTGGQAVPLIDYVREFSDAEN